MRSKTHLTLIFLALLLALFLPGSITLGPSYAQEEAAPGIPAPFFDWSDFRATFGTRVFLMKLNAASFNFRDLQGSSFDPDPAGFGHAAFKNDPEPVPQFWGELYIDRLGIRAYYEEPMLRARTDIGALLNPAPFNIPPQPATQSRIIELTLSSSRIGFDVDVIRRPYFRIGPDFDVHFSGVKYEEKYTQGIPGTTIGTVLGPAVWYQEQPYVPAPPPPPPLPPSLGPATFVLHRQLTLSAQDSIVLTGQAPVTIGVHARAIPGRIREVPITLQARVRFPIPFLDYFTKLGDVRVVDYEFSAGLRPVVWETSFIGHSTFSMSIEAGFRSLSIETPMTVDISRLGQAGTAYALPKEINFRSHWQGAFFQVVGFF